MNAKSILMEQYNRNIIRALLGLKVAERPVQVPGDDEVLIKVHAASCNPSDIAFLQGGYNIVKALPAVPGFEGAGVVVEAGKNIPPFWVGKRVSFFIRDDRPGSWSEYVTVPKKHVIVLQDGMDMDQAACFSVNPVTAWALVETARSNGTEGIVQNASGGQVAGFVRKLARELDMEVIDVVRKEENIADLKADGASFVFWEKDPDLSEKLKALTQKLNILIAFDAVAGEQAGILFNALPENGQLLVYGGLSNKPVSGLDSLDLIFKNKKVSGFNLPAWKEQVAEQKFQAAVHLLQQKFIDGTLQTAIQGETGFEHLAKGLKNYIGNMSAGKILIKPTL